MISLLRKTGTSCRSFRSIAASIVNGNNGRLCSRYIAQSNMQQFSHNYSAKAAIASSLEAFDFDDNARTYKANTKDNLEGSGEFSNKRPIAEFKFSKTLLNNLKKANITHLFPVQAKSFDSMMNGVDIVGRSKTGSGKTLAFGLPIVEKLLQRQGLRKHPGALILLPTRELATQVASEISRISPQLRTVTVVGGVSYQSQENELRSGVDVLVGTPGRIMDLVDKGKLSLTAVEFAVLDEADMMLKFGFQEAVETILSWVPETRQCVMWSATFPKWVNSLSKKYLKDAISIDLVGEDQGHVPETVVHKAMHISPPHRTQALQNILRQCGGRGQTLVFTETKQEANEIANNLNLDSVRALHGDLSQHMRAATMKAFRNGSIKTLVCTDIAARGLDIANVDLVVHYRIPSDRENFVHRSGRTGRAGRSGTSIIFFDKQETWELKSIERQYKLRFTHACPPHVEHVLDSTVKDLNNRLLKVPKDTSSLFSETASRLYAEHGNDIFSSALALLCGFDSTSVQSISMLTGKANMCTVQLKGLDSVRAVSDLIVKATGNAPSRDIQSLENAFILDVPSSDLSKLTEYVKSNELNEVSIQKVQELPKLLVTATFDRQLGSGNNRRGNGSFNYKGRVESPKWNARRTSSSRYRDSQNRQDRSYDRYERSSYSDRRRDRFDDVSFNFGRRKSDRYSDEE